MTCEEAFLLISGHLDHENTPEEEAQLQAHLQSCEDCALLMEIFRENDKALGSLWEEPPVDLRNKIMDAVGREAKRQKQKKNPSWIVTTLATAAMVALIVGSGWINRPKEMTENTALSPKVRTASVQDQAVASDEGIAAFGAPQAASTLSAVTGQELADLYGAPVSVLHNIEVEDIPELAAECVPAECVDGSLYMLETAQSAEELCQEYGGELYLPMVDVQGNDADVEQDSDVSYVLLAGN